MASFSPSACRRLDRVPRAHLLLPPHVVLPDGEQYSTQNVLAEGPRSGLDGIGGMDKAKELAFATSCVVSILSKCPHPSVCLCIAVCFIYNMHYYAACVYILQYLSIRWALLSSVPRRSSLRQGDSFPRVARRRLWVPDLNLWCPFSEAQAEEHTGASESDPP